MQSLQSSAVPSWNHKLVSMKPKLEPVPEGGPATGGPLNLMPLTTANGNGLHGSNGHSMQLPPLSSSQPHSASEYVNLDSGGRGGLHGSLPSAGTLANQLQMTHVRSESQLAGLDGGGGGGPVSSGGHHLQVDSMTGQQHWHQQVRVCSDSCATSWLGGMQHKKACMECNRYCVGTHAGWTFNAHASACEWQHPQQPAQVSNCCAGSSRKP
jgi:hypothetical protein